MLNPRLDLSRSPIKIPERFHKVVYDPKRYPGAPGVRGVYWGANCQRYAYEFVRAFGFTIPDFRSSDLWADTAQTHLSDRPKPFDLVLVHNAPIAWGAHVGVYLGNGFILHLSKKIGAPAMESVQLMMRRAEYRHLLGLADLGERIESMDEQILIGNQNRMIIRDGAVHRPSHPWSRWHKAPAAVLSYRRLGICPGMARPR